MNCPCESQKEIEACCQPIIDGQPAKTAEALMRARYTAYTQKKIAFIEKSHDPKTRHKTDMEANLRWAQTTEWKRLKILRVEKGQAEDDWGLVEFQADYRSKDSEGLHHEVSEFNKKGGQWFFSKGKTPQSLQKINTEPRIGRNDPCSCGSGKKYKKCCAQ